MYSSRVARAQSCTSRPRWCEVPCTIQRRWYWPCSLSRVSSTDTPSGSRPQACRCSAMTRMAAACTSENCRPGPHGGDAGLLRGEHGVVDLALGVGEGAGDRQGAGDVGGVEGVDLDAGVDEHEVALAHLAGVLDPVQGVGVVAGRADRVVADAVAAVPGVQREGALEPALAAALLDGARAARRSSPRTRGGWRRRRPASARPRGRPCASAGARCRGPGRRRPPAGPPRRRRSRPGRRRGAR